MSNKKRKTAQISITRYGETKKIDLPTE